jgi:hypothetical protein
MTGRATRVSHVIPVRMQRASSIIESFSVGLMSFMESIHLWSLSVLEVIIVCELQCVLHKEK